MLSVRRHVSPLLPCALLCGFTSSAALAAPPSAVLLTDIPVDAPGATNADAGLRAALEPFIGLLDAQRTDRLREQAQQLGLACVALDESCAVGFGQLINSDEVITVTVERIAGGFLVRGARVSPTTGRSVQKVAGRLGERPGDGGQPLAALVAGLFGEPRLATVPVRIAVDRPAAAVQVDGAEVDRIDGVAWLLPGAHTVEAAAGGARASTTITVPGDGSIALVSLVMKDEPAVVPAPPPIDVVTPTIATSPAPPAAATATAAATANDDGGWLAPVVLIGGAATGIVGVVVWLGVDDAIGEKNRAAVAAQDPASYTKADREGDQGVGLVGVALACVGTAGVVAGAVLWGLE